jgi:dienelactone hydrolase
MDHLASHGYIVIATTSEGSLLPNHANFALDIRQCLTWLEEQNALASSWLVGDVNTAAFGVSGHSMGGGASALAAAADPRIKCLATLAAAETNPSAAAAATSIQRPSCFITGAQDAIVAPSSTLNQYNNCDAPRQFVSIAGGSHCGFVDSAIIGCDSGTLARPDQLAKTRSLLLDWFDAHLRLQSSAFTATWGMGTPIAGTTTTRDARTTLTLGASALSGAAGTKPLETTITITNIGPDSTAFVLRASSSLFDVSFVPATIAELAAGQSATATVRVASSAAGNASVVIDVVRGRDAAGASAALTVNFTAPPTSPADLDHNGVVNAVDLAILQSSWGKCAGCAADFDNNGAVDAADLAVLLANWS